MSEDGAPAERSWSRRFGKAFNYAHNPISVVGIVLTTVSALSILAFVAIDMGGGLRNPYIGIFAYFLLPAVFVLGLVLLPLGMVLRRRRMLRDGLGETERRRYPKLDFNDPRLRRLATVTLVLTAANAVIFGISSFLAVDYMESTEFCGQACHTPMEPEFVAYQSSPHSQVACVECHVGPGARSFVEAKLRGLSQLWHTVGNSYARPIETPIDMHPASETCGHCHAASADYGERVRTIARFSEDEENTPSYSVMVLPVGGGRQDLGRHGGIHWWHVESDNRIRYVADEKRETISWVELTTPEGEVRIYGRDGEEPPSSAEIEGARTMDCMDCHNRPAHRFVPPTLALDDLLAAESEIASLPFYKQRAVELVEGEYATREEGIAQVREGLLAFYRDDHPEVFGEQRDTVEAAARNAAEIYGRTVFPEMQTDWRTHQNHIGHEISPGCFRCHDEELATADGEHVISIDCESCHTFLVEDVAEPPNLAALIHGG